MEGKKIDFDNLTEEQKKFLKEYKASDSFFTENTYYVGAGCLYNYDIILAVSILNDIVNNAGDARKIGFFEEWLKITMITLEDEVKSGKVMEDDAEALITFLTKVTEHIGRCVGLAGVHKIESNKVKFELSEILREICEAYNLTDNYSLLIGKPMPEQFRKLMATPYGLSYFGKSFASFATFAEDLKLVPSVVYINNAEKLMATQILGIQSNRMVQYDTFKDLIKTEMLAPENKAVKTVVYVADNTIYNSLVKYMGDILEEHEEANKPGLAMNVIIRPTTSAYGETQSVIWDALDPQGMAILKKEIDEFAGATVEE